MNSAPLIHARFVLLLVLVALASGGCELAGDIFKAGMWVGVIMVALILVVIFWIMGKVRR